jgi:hypothetical protein
MRRSATAFALVVLATAIAAAVAAAALTPAAYRAKANAACTVTKRKLDALGRPRTQDDYARYVRATVLAGRTELATLRRLRPPASLRASHEQALKAIAQELKVLNGALVRMHEGEPAQVALLPTQKPIERLARQEDAAWRRAGVRVCAQD